MKPFLGIGAILVFFATAGACSPKLRRAYLEAAAKKAQEEREADLPLNFDDRIEKAHHPKRNDERPVFSPEEEPIEEWMEREVIDGQQASSDLPSQRSLDSFLKPKSIYPRSVSPTDPPAIALDPDMDTKRMIAAFGQQQIPSAPLNPTAFLENSPEWNLAMINYLLQMKEAGHKIQEIHTDKPLSELHRDLTWSGMKLDDPLVCKTAPYNICYRLDKHGVLHPLGDRRPVRILRVYK